MNTSNENTGKIQTHGIKANYANGYYFSPKKKTTVIETTYDDKGRVVKTVETITEQEANTPLPYTYNPSHIPGPAIYNSGGNLSQLYAS